MTTHVRVMYMLDKHVHALNLLDINIDRSNFPEHVRVWRLILKKITLVISTLQIKGIKYMALLCLRSAFASSPLYLRYKTVPNPFLRIGEKWDLHRIYKGFARELQVCIFTLEKKHFRDKPTHLHWHMLQTIDAQKLAAFSNTA